MKCKDCEHYCPFEDNYARGICDKDNKWSPVFAINECSKKESEE